MGGWHVWTGNVRPGPAAHEPRVQIDAAEPPEESAATRSGRTTIDATFSVVSEPKKGSSKESGPGAETPDPSSEPG